MLHYINTSYKPGAKDLVAEFYVEPARGVSLEKAAENVALESSIGTWTTISTMNPRVAKQLKPSVYYIKDNIIRVAYPEKLFEPGNVSQILSSIAGNIYGMKIVKNLKLLDLHFPGSFMRQHKGPLFGVKGIRKLTGVRKRPLVGTIVKPKVGLTPKQHAKVAYDAWSGGLDVVKDDENLASMPFNKFRERVIETVKLKNKAEQETGEKKIYMPNITAETLEMIKRAEFVKEQGNEYMMIDILTVGWAALQTMRIKNEELGLVIHAHRAMHAALTRNPKHGMSMLVIAKLARLVGVDQLHIGTAAIGKMYGSKDEELDIEREVEDSKVNEHGIVLEQSWPGIKPILAVASGGLSPLSTPKLIETMGTNIVAQYGGGCHGHPDGTLAGARAIRQSLDASMKSISLKKYANNHPELKRAIEKWG